MNNPVLNFRRFLIVSVPLVAVVYAVWYWSSDHQQLTAFYRQLNPDFYKATNWSSVFFTAEVKSAGNWWCLAAVIASAGWAFLAWKSRLPHIPKLKFTKNQSLVYAGIAVAGIILSLIANIHTNYGTDEVFSALNFASLPSFQCASYYVLPNNHILFNLINGIGSTIHFNLVESGRFLSLICYVIALCSSWYFLQKWIRSSWLRVLSLLLLALQLHAWGFSGQARGYELVFLLSLLSLFTFWGYWFENKEYLLPLHAGCNVAGMLTVPSYLYWWVGLMLASFLFMIWEKRIDRGYIKAALGSALMTLLVFLPLLTFSGLTSLSHNEYVRPRNANGLDFITDLYDLHYVKGLFNDWFCSGTFTAGIEVLCLLCMALVFFYPRRDKKYRALGIIWVSMLIAFISMATLMLRTPFNRNLIAQGYLAEMFILIALGTFVTARLTRIASVLLLSGVIVYSAVINFNRMPSKLYEFDVNSCINKLSACKTPFRPRCTIWLDDECFYWDYILKRKYPDPGFRIMLNKSAFARQDYCILPSGMQPPSDTAGYRISENIGEYTIYERIR